MENVLDTYKRPYNPAKPVVCMDESPGQLIGEIKSVVPAKPGFTQKYDYEYKRNGTYNIFMVCEPLVGKRFVKITERRTIPDWAHIVEDIANMYKDAEKITLVMDNLNTHKPESLYSTFEPEKAKRLWDRFKFVYTPKHGSWLNMAEIELNVLTGQCLKRRIDNIETVRKESIAWMEDRNNKDSKINWRFTSDDARIKLKRLYPTLEA